MRGYSSGTNNGYFWSLYTEVGSASINFSNDYEGNFEIEWSGVNDVVGGKGWSTGSSRTIGYNLGALSGSYKFFGVYGWTRNPLIEYYIVEKGSVGGSNCGSVSSDVHSYQLSRNQRVNKPSIDGTQTFWQYFSTWVGAPTDQDMTISMSTHINAWRNSCGHGFGNHDYQILAVEEWGGGSGYCNATVWESGGGGGSNSFVIRARGTGGGEHIYLSVGDNQVADWNLSTSYQNYSASTNNTGGTLVCFDNDDGENMDVQIDYMDVNGERRHAEDQTYNTGVWQNDECGGGDGHSEMLHCEGCIGFGDVSGGGGGGATTTAATTTTASSWWGGSSWYGSTTTSSGYTTTTASASTTTTASSWWGGGSWW